MSTSVFTTFQLNEQLFGIDIRFIREINRQLDLSSVPHAPDYICGLINLRGQIVTVIDLKRRLGFERTLITDETHNLILKTDQEIINSFGLNEVSESAIPDKVGLLVDQIGDIVSVETSAITLPPANAGKVDGQYLSGAVALSNGLLTILSMNPVLKGAH
jgi:purine-binding chemotaxis protein CheW